MAIQKFLKNLKTVKWTRFPRAYGKQLPYSISQTLISPSSAFLSDLNPTKLHQILSYPRHDPSKCLNFFNFVLKKRYLLSFEPDLQAHLTLISRLLGARRFSDAENLLKYALIDQCNRYPFSILASTIENCCCLEPKIITKLFNLMISVYSDNKKYGLVTKTFDHMKNKGIKIDERTCTMHLFALKRDDQMRSSLEFFNQMIESGIEVSVYSLTAVVDGLCQVGEIEICRKLMEEMTSKGIIKPNVVTYNVMIDACAKRWNFQELDSLLVLMENDGVAFNENTFRILIDGYTSFGKIQEAEELVLKMHDRHMKADTHLYNLIINGYYKLGLIDRSLSLFDKMISRDVNCNVDTCWAIINGICKAGKMEAAMVYVSKMQRKGVELDQDMFDRLVDGFCSKGMVEEAFALRTEMATRGLDADIDRCCRIVSGLLKLKRFEEAKCLMNMMVSRGEKLQS